MEPMTQTLARTLHVDTNDIPWVPSGVEGADQRLVQSRLEEGFVVTQFRAQPGIVSGLHRHRAGVLGYTLKGRWGHDRRFEYSPGTYIFETPGVLHRFMNGPDVSEVLFINFSVIEMVDPSTKEVIATITPQDTADAYFTKCEELGIPRPNVLA